MPKTDASPLRDELVLAALERAQHHQRLPERPGVLVSVVKEHLGLSRHTKRLQPVWDRLHTRGLVEATAHQGLTLWRLTSAGKRRLTIARRESPIRLPEAPQHRRWREASAAAGECLPHFRDELERALDLARLLLDGTDRAVTSEDWFALSEHLREAAWRVGSATYCAGEWAEPDDAAADVEISVEHGRRDVQRWK